MSSNYWERAAQRRLHRRSILGGAGGIAAAAVVGCGDDNSTNNSGTSTAQPSPGASAATSPTQDAAKIKRGGTLRVYDAIATDVFDPAITIHAGSLFNGVVQVYDYVNRLAEGYKLEAHMAKLPEQPDQTTLIYKLNPGIKWQNRAPLNGRAFTAEDMAFGFQRFRENNPEFTFGARLSLIDKMEAVDGQTLKITTAKPFVPLVSNLAEENMVMVAKEAVDRFGNDGLKKFENMVGTGAWMPGTFQQGVKSTLVKNPDYWQSGKPYLDAIETVQITDNAQKQAAIVSGQVDMSAGWGGIETKQFGDDVKRQMGNDIIVAAKPIVSRVTAHFNTNRDFFKDARVRRALHLAADRQAMWAAMQFNHSMMGVIPQQVQPFGFKEDYLRTLPGFRDKKDEDIAEAKKLLAAAGFANGFSFTVLGSTPLNEVMQANWKQIGVNATLKPASIAEWSAARSAGNFDMVAVSNTSAVDPDFELYGNCHSKGTANFGKFSDSDVDRLADKQRVTFDINERKKITDELQLKLFDQSPQIWSFSYSRWNIYRPYVQGWRVIPALEGWPYADTWLSK